MDSLKNENHLAVILAHQDPRQKETAPKCQAVLSQSEGDIDFMSCILDYVKDKGLGVANVTKLPVLGIVKYHDSCQLPNDDGKTALEPFPLGVNRWGARGDRCGDCGYFSIRLEGSAWRLN
jgi:hypothetical protein